MYKIRFSNPGYKRLKKLSRSDIKRILKKIETLKNFSSKTKNIKKMVATSKKIYRYRIGDIRVLFELDKQKSTIWIIDIAYRGSIY